MADEGEALRDTATRCWKELERMGWETTSKHLEQVLANVGMPRDCICHSEWELQLELDNEWGGREADEADAAEEEDGVGDEGVGEEGDGVADGYQADGDPYVEGAGDEEGVAEAAEDDAQATHDGEAWAAWYAEMASRTPRPVEEMWDPRDEV